MFSILRLDALIEEHVLGPPTQVSSLVRAEHRVLDGWRGKVAELRNYKRRRLPSHSRIVLAYYAYLTRLPLSLRFLPKLSVFSSPSYSEFFTILFPGLFSPSLLIPPLFLFLFLFYH